MRKSKKGINQSNIHIVLRKVNRVICIMYPNCMPDIMIQTQAVLQIFLTRLLFYTKCQSRKWEIIQPNIYRILRKVNQVIYTLDNLWAKYHDPSSNGFSVILLTIFQLEINFIFLTFVEV